MDRHFRFLEHLSEDRFRHVRLERPHRRVCRSQISSFRLAAAAFAEVILASLKFPRGISRVIAGHAPIKLARHAADSRFVADVRCAQPAAGQPAKMFAELRQHRRFAHPRRLHRRRDTTARRPIHAHIGFNHRTRAPFASSNGNEDKKGCESDTHIGEHIPELCSQLRQAAFPVCPVKKRPRRFKKLQEPTLAAP